MGHWPREIQGSPGKKPAEDESLILAVVEDGCWFGAASLAIYFAEVVFLAVRRAKVLVKYTVIHIIC
jgi:hypothetical protein